MASELSSESDGGKKQRVEVRSFSKMEEGTGQAVPDLISC